MINPAQQSYLDYLAGARRDQWAKIKKYREYAAGEHQIQLTNRQKILLTGAHDQDPTLPAWNPEFVLNICETILSVEVDRLRVKGLNITVPDDPERSEAETKRIWDWWKRNRMDAMAPSAFYAAARDGDAYGVLEYDPARGPIVIMHRAYDGESGVEMVYEDDDPARPLFAVKRWDVQRPAVGQTRLTRVRRKNLYYPDRIEKYISSTERGDQGWRPLAETDPGFDPAHDVRTTVEDAYGNSYDATVAWWTTTGTRDGEPLGIAVIHFAHDPRGEAFGASTIADVVPGLQDAINMAALALQAATVFNGYKEVVLVGVELPVDVVDSDSSYEAARKLFYRHPASIHVLESPDAKVLQLQETNLQQLIDVKDSLIKDAATLTGTPLAYFNLTGQIAAEGTQQQMESPLLAKTQRNQIVFGNALEDMARLWLRLEAAYGDGLSGGDQAALEAWDINCEWHTAQTRNEREVTDLAIARYRDLGIPRDTAWKEAGYSADERAEMQEDLETDMNRVLGELTTRIQEAEQEADGEAINAPTNPGANGAGARVGAVAGGR